MLPLLNLDEIEAAATKKMSRERDGHTTTQPQMTCTPNA